MPVFEIEQYELYVQGYLVEADSEADAIARFFQGEGNQERTSIEFAGMGNGYGMNLDDNRDLASRLFDLGIIKGGDTIIPSIRSIREVTSGPTPDEDDNP